jgi:cellulose synthase/poly-beta-1,6-N-acetylglucosamine synthase-like glycosyltransferase
LNITSFSIVDWTLLGILLGLFLAQVYWYSRYMAAPARRLRKDKKSSISKNEVNRALVAENLQSPMSEAPGVSVILAAHNESENLSQYLQALLTQDYPLYEVIVVDDGSEDETRAVVESYMVRDPRLHLTFVPYGARVASTKKLALTLAAKAAQYDYLLLTDADCVPESNQWIRSMMAGFQADKQIVLGFGAYFYDKGHVNRLVRFDTLFNGLHYLGAALCGHPYMGVGRNLAYRKSLFFESGGFTHMMGNRSGDDDLFVNYVATKANTAVVLNRESYTWSPAKKTMKEWWQQKRRHLSVSPNYRLGTKIRLALEPISRGLFYAMLIVIGVHYPVISIPFAAAAGLFFVRWWFQTAVLNVSARRMGLHRFSMWSVLWFDITLPLVNLYMLIVPRKKKNIW